MKSYIIVKIVFLLSSSLYAQYSSEQILDRYREAIGGEEAWRHIKSFKIEMEGESDSQKAKVEHYMLKPHFYKMVFNFPNLKRTLTYYGTEGKILINNEITPMPDDMKIEMREEPDFYDELIFYDEKGYGLEKLKDTIIEKTLYWKFALIKNPEDTQFYYINKANYLLEIIEEYSEEKKHKGVLFKTTFDNYKEVGNVLFPMQMDLYKDNDLWISYTLKKVHMNYSLSADDFIVGEDNLKHVKKK